MKFPSMLVQNKGLPAQAGFTIMEMIVTLGILVILLGLTTPFVVHFYRRYQLDNERSILLSILRQARNLSMDGESTSDHGVQVATNQFTLFTGTSYTLRDTSKDQTFSRVNNVTATGSSSITFRYLTGKSSSSSFTLDDGTKTGKIYVNTEGRIDWQ